MWQKWQNSAKKDGFLPIFNVFLQNLNLGLFGVRHVQEGLCRPVEFRPIPAYIWSVEIAACQRYLACHGSAICWPAQWCRAVPNGCGEETAKVALGLNS